MKFLAPALICAAALATQSVHAQEQFISTCDMECFRPFNGCLLEAQYGNGKEEDCRAQQDKCLKECVAKNGIKKWVYKAEPHREAKEEPKKKTEARSYNFRSVDDGKEIN